jgi:hypothetical protein
MLAKSIGTLTDLDPTQDLTATLQQAVHAAKQQFDADAAGNMLADIDGQLRWASASDQRAQVLEDNQEVFAAGPCMQAFTSGWPVAQSGPWMCMPWTRGLGRHRGHRGAASAGVVASLLGAAARPSSPVPWSTSCRPR